MTSDQVSWIQNHFVALWFFAVGWIGVVLAVSALWRRMHGLPVMMPTFAQPRFEERWCSGGRGIFWARNCAWIVVLSDRIVTGVHFPFGLLIPRPWLKWAGLDTEIPLADLLEVDSAASLAGRAVEIRYRTGSALGQFQIISRRGDELLRILGAHPTSKTGR